MIVAIRLSPGHADVFYNRGIAHNAKGQYDRAIEDYNEAIRLDPNYANAFNNRGNTYNAKAQYYPAIEDFNQAIRLNPNQTMAFYNRGISCEWKNDLQRAWRISRSPPNWPRPIRMVQRELSASQRR